VQEILSEAVCTINLCGPVIRHINLRPKGKLVYLETDPVLYQIRLAQAIPPRSVLGRTRWHVTYGENWRGRLSIPCLLSVAEDRPQSSGLLRSD